MGSRLEPSGLRQRHSHGLDPDVPLHTCALNASYQLAHAPNLDQSFDPIRFPAIGLDKMLVIGAEAGAVVGAIAGAVPANRTAI